MPAATVTALALAALRRRSELKNILPLVVSVVKKIQDKRGDAPEQDKHKMADVALDPIIDLLADDASPDEKKALKEIFIKDGVRMMKTAPFDRDIAIVGANVIKAAQSSHAVLFDKGQTKSHEFHVKLSDAVTPHVIAAIQAGIVSTDG